MRKKILLITNQLIHYRMPLYQFIGENYDLTIYLTATSLAAYSFAKKNIENQNDIASELANYSFKIIYKKERSLWKEMNSNNYELIIGGNWNSIYELWVMFLLFLYRNKNHKVRWILWGAAKWKTFLNWQLFIIHNCFLKFILWRVDSFMVFGETHKKFFEKFFKIRGNKISMICNISEIYQRQFSIDEDLKELFKTENDNIIIGFVGRADLDWKGIYFLEEAFNELNKKHSNISLFIIGSNYNYVNSKVYKFCAQLPSQMKEVYENIDILVLPSIEVARTLEGWGLVINEAFQFGIPVIVTDKVGAKDIVQDGVNGYVVPEKNSQAIADKLNLLINDEKLRDKIGKNNLEFYKKKLTYDYCFTQWEKYLNNFM